MVKLDEIDEILKHYEMQFDGAGTCYLTSVNIIWSYYDVKLTFSVLIIGGPRACENACIFIYYII